MSYNGSGVYSLPGAALANGETVSASEHNTFRNDVATAFNVAWTRDGQSSASADIPMNSHKFTGLAAGTTAGDSVRFEQLPSASNQIVTAQIADDAVTTAKILDANVTAGKLASDAVTTEKILDANVTTAKIADGAVTVAKTSGFGTAATKDTGTSAGNVVVLDGSAKLPAVDGSQLTGVQSLVSGTAQATTGTGTIDFTGIPSWAKRVTVMFSGVSTNATAGIVVQLGTSGGVVSSGYTGGALQGFSTTNFGVYSHTNGFLVGTGGSASATINGAIRLEKLSSNVWTASGTTIDQTTLRSCSTGGSVSLSGTLDRIRITTSDTFDAGSVNILYE